MSRSSAWSSAGALAVHLSERRPSRCARHGRRLDRPGPSCRVPGRAQDRVDRQVYAEDVLEQQPRKLIAPSESPPRSAKLYGRREVECPRCRGRTPGPCRPSRARSDRCWRLGARAAPRSGCAPTPRTAARVARRTCARGWGACRLRTLDSSPFSWLNGSISMMKSRGTSNDLRSCAAATFFSSELMSCLSAASSASSPSSVADHPHIRDDDGEQVRPRRVPVDVHLLDHGAAALEGRPQHADGDELALRELEHVVSAIDEDDVVRSALFHDVAGEQVSILVE